MCLILIAHRVIEGTDLLLVSNRDERYDRAAVSAGFWDDRPDILGGRDLERGGTWLALSKPGRLAAVTNIREPENNNPHAPSRGSLPVEFVTQRSNVRGFLEHSQGFERYNGFNLIMWDGQDLVAASNRSESMLMPPGVHGVSNGLLSSYWPKVRLGIESLEKQIKTGDVSNEQILDIMRDQSQKEDELLPDTGVGLEMERILSSAFIRTDNYGTRCTTIVRVETGGQILYDEFTYDEAAQVVNVTQFEVRPDSA